jgi:hypothetical protein
VSLFHSLCPSSNSSLSSYCFKVTHLHFHTDLPTAANTTVDAQYIVGKDAEIAVGEPRGSLVHARPGTATSGQEKEIALESTGAGVSGAAAMAHDYEGKPTPEELTTLRRVADTLPTVAYVLCFAELCERASYYGTANVITNFINRKLPIGGNGGGAPPQHTDNPLAFGQTRKPIPKPPFSLGGY